MTPHCAYSKQYKLDFLFKCLFHLYGNIFLKTGKKPIAADSISVTFDYLIKSPHQQQMVSKVESV
jgi:hypothetical protein